jgi:hypothetical protein
MDATETVILVSIFLLAAALIALPRVLGRRGQRSHPDGDPGEQTT